MLDIRLCVISLCVHEPSTADQVPFAVQVVDSAPLKPSLHVERQVALEPMPAQFASHKALGAGGGGALQNTAATKPAAAGAATGQLYSIKARTHVTMCILRAA